MACRGALRELVSCNATGRRGPGSFVAALDKLTGKEVGARPPTHLTYATPVLVNTRSGLN